jgi:hypothetical protein
MGDPRNPARADELWNPVRFNVLLAEVKAIAPGCVLSGGWAWHFMSPPHEELKLHHDHRDIDVFVKPQDLAPFLVELQLRGYQKVWTRFDQHSKDRFYRYEKHVPTPTESVKVIIDLFVEEILNITVQGMNVVEPKKLLSLYKRVHSTNDCTAVKAATLLVEKGINPVGRSEMVTP